MRKKKEQTNRSGLREAAGQMVEIMRRASDPAYYFTGDSFDARSFRAMVSSLRELADTAEHLSDAGAEQIVVEMGEAAEYAE